MATSGNNLLIRGPDFTNNFIVILTRFRLDPIAIASDVKAMFHQVMYQVSSNPTALTDVMA